MHITDALYVNDAGEIAAIATLPNGDYHAVLLIPLDRENCGNADCEPDNLRAAGDLGHNIPHGSYAGLEARTALLHAKIFQKNH